MSRIRAVSELNERELGSNESEESSWHAQYKGSPYIYIGSLSYELSEGDIRAIFSQYGEVLETNLIRDKESGKSKGFAFIRFADYRSTILAVDNFNGISILGRSIRVDHVLDYRSKNDTKIEMGNKEDIISRMTEEILNTGKDLDHERLERLRRKQERRERETSEERRVRKLRSLRKKDEI